MVERSIFFSPSFFLTCPSHTLAGSEASLLLRCPLFPGPFADSWRFSVAVLPSADALRPAPAVAALLTASGSEDLHRGPYQTGVATFRDTPENVGRQGLRQARLSIYWHATRRGECCHKSGHGSGRKRGAFVWPHTQKVNVSPRNVCCQAGWGKGGNRERQTACCAEEKDAHHEASYADATSVARR